MAGTEESNSAEEQRILVNDSEGIAQADCHKASLQLLIQVTVHQKVFEAVLSMLRNL